ncbi:MAG: serine hydrolase domain-containing protein [Pelagimonas sp.]|uniref:serine hydrolase domain-containing protein n=1 Tax=Pelagimonas sp. TaxID=2073170 RepID=UPI003D6BCC51
MNDQTDTSRLHRMMMPYESPRHTVVAFSLIASKPQIIGSGPNDTQAPWEDLIFEIGSITKVFTGILLCVLVEEGKIDPHAPFSELSDALSDVPSSITPERLASHTSGLPNIYAPIWKVLFQQRPDGPYAGFTRRDLFTWLHNWHAKDSGGNLRHSYSNLGAGLLGEAMAMQAGRPFTELLAERVIHPLGLTDTTGDLDGDQRSRFMFPRNTADRPVIPWTFDALAGAGYLRSTARDLARFSRSVVQAINAPETVLDYAIKRSAKPIFGVGRRGSSHLFAQCSGWMSMKPDPSGPTSLFANGGTAGSTCALFLCPEKERAIAILSNNGVAASLWARTKLSWSSPTRQAHDYFTAG